MLICILTKNVITSCSVTMMLFLHLEVKPLMTLTTVRSEERFSRNAETDLVCRLLLEKKKNKTKQQREATKKQKTPTYTQHQQANNKHETKTAQYHVAEHHIHD